MASICRACFSNDLREIPYFFKAFSFYEKKKAKKPGPFQRKIALRYEFYRNNVQQSQFYFIYEKVFRKAILKKAIWYQGNRLQRVHTYFLRPKNAHKRYYHEFLYYNHFGVLIRKVQHFFNTGIGTLSRSVVDSSFLFPSRVLGYLD